MSEYFTICLVTGIFTTQPFLRFTKNGVKSVGENALLIARVQRRMGRLMDVLLAHFRLLSPNWALFKCHGLPEHCFWPCPSLSGHHVSILWWLLPAE